jgi:hypothetical protein
VRAAAPGDAASSGPPAPTNTGLKDHEARAHLGSFGVSGPLALQAMYTLSGGQKSRVALAKVWRVRVCACVCVCACVRVCAVPPPWLPCRTPTCA